MSTSELSLPPFAHSRNQIKLHWLTLLSISKAKTSNSDCNDGDSRPNPIIFPGSYYRISKLHFSTFLMLPLFYTCSTSIGARSFPQIPSRGIAPSGVSKPVKVSVDIQAGGDLWPRSSLACCVARLTRPGLTVWTQRAPVSPAARARHLRQGRVDLNGNGS